MVSFLLFMPTMLLSGFMFPVSSMPRIFQVLTLLNPLRHYLEIVRALFLKGVGAAGRGAGAGRARPLRRRRPRPGHLSLPPRRVARPEARAGRRPHDTLASARGSPGHRVHRRPSWFLTELSGSDFVWITCWSSPRGGSSMSKLVRIAVSALAVGLCAAAGFALKEDPQNFAADLYVPGAPALAAAAAPRGCGGARPDALPDSRGHPGRQRAARPRTPAAAPAAPTPAPCRPR